MNVSPHVPEPDDALHNPTVRDWRVVEYNSSACISKRGLANVGCLGILVLGLLTLLSVFNTAVSLDFLNVLFPASFTRFSST